MTSVFKPQRPNGDVNAALQSLNPRSQRMIAGVDQILSAPKGSPRTALQDMSNLSPRIAKKTVPIPTDESPTAVPIKYVVPKAPVAPPRPAEFAPAPSGPSARSRSSPVPGPSTQSRSISPNTALQRHASSLSAYEKHEIRSYEEIFFVGEGSRKLQNSPTGSSTNNCGYDDDKGDYKVISDDHIGYRYQVLSELGRGSFGQVSKALDHKTKQIVALKIIKNKKKFHDQALIEVELLKHLRDHDPCEKYNIVKLVDNFIFRNHMVITFELHGMNIYELCKSNRFAPMNLPIVKHFAKQLLTTLQFLFTQKIVHCDLKPENILLKQGSKSTIKVIDFGSSCFENQRLYTYIQSRFYRAPEVMLGIPYTTGIDMWSFGCILAELANGYPIFPGESEQEQMCCLMEFLGVPPKSLVERGTRKKNFFETNGSPRLPPNSRGKVRRPSSKDLSSFLRVSTTNINDPESGLFVDFITKCLAWDPQQRWSPAQAMQHPWIIGVEQAAQSSSRQPNSGTAQTPVTASGSPRVLLPMLPQSTRRPL